MLPSHVLLIAVSCFIYLLVIYIFKKDKLIAVVLVSSVVVATQCKFIQYYKSSVKRVTKVNLRRLKMPSKSMLSVLAIAS